MIARLIRELGFDIESVIRGNAPAKSLGDSKTYDVFHVKDAFGNAGIPAQDEFVVPYGVTP